VSGRNPVGAAVATLVSYVAATYEACFQTRRACPVAVDMTLGRLLPLRAGYSRRGTPARIATGGEPMSKVALLFDDYGCPQHVVQPTITGSALADRLRALVEAPCGRSS